MAGATFDNVNAETLTFTPTQDTTIFQEASDNSNGAGGVFIAGRAGGAGNPAPLRRALLQFDLSTIAQGSLIQSVSLTLTLTQSAGANLVSFGLYRVASSWGEAGSIAPAPGQGIAAAAGDATWAARAFAATPASPWITAGGDYVPVASASTFVGGLTSAAPTPYTWLTTPQLVTDVQSWLDNPATNSGWILIGGEGNSGTARQFASSENLTTGYVPMLTIVSAPVPEPSTGIMLVAGLGMALALGVMRTR